MKTCVIISHGDVSKRGIAKSSMVILYLTFLRTAKLPIKHFFNGFLMI